MTYEQLKNIINAMTEEQLKLTAVVYVGDTEEYYGLNEYSYNITETDNEELGSNYPYLSI